jgi:protein involved in polysaccharide export with SLBB domain
MYSQVPPISAAQAQAELQKRGITEEELRAKLLEKGINLDNIDPTNPTDVAKAQKAIEEAIKEIEAEKQQAQNNNLENNKLPENPKGVDSIKETAEEIKQTIEEKVEDQIGKASQESVEEISEAVEEGKSIEEAVAEEASELRQDQLPNSNIYGQQLFRNKTLKLYTKSEDALPPSTYVLGAGDELNISIWGISQADFNLEVQKDGYIYPTGLARVYLKGLTLDKAKEILGNRFSSYYQFSREQFEVNLKFVRTLNINIWGEAENIGSFNIPATNTAFNALVAAGGPSKIGSVRNIQLIRPSGTKKVDIYKFMDDPMIQSDLYLENSDVIYIPISERLISIGGAVKRPMIYELIEGENLFQLIEYAGGLTANAYTEIIQIQRIQDNQRTIIDVNLQDLLDNQKDFELLNGDVVSLKTIPRPFQNFVEINGTVEFPGKFALEPGMRISDLLEKGILLPESRKDIAFLLRANEDGTANWERVSIENILNDSNSSQNLTLKPKDKLSVYSLERYADNATISITGAVRQPNEFPYDANKKMSVEDLVLLGGGLELNATQTAYIRRINPSNRTQRDNIKINIFEAISNNQDTINNVLLKPFDQLVIYTEESFSDDYKVSTQGSVRNPGEYGFDEELRISDLIYFSNGLKPDATNFGYIRRTDPASPEEYQYIRVDNLKEIVSNPNLAENINVEPQDVFQVYSKETYTDKANVTIGGAVRIPGEYRFDPTLKLKDILTMAGGLRLEASTSKIDIFRIVIETDQPTKTIVATLEVDENLNVINGGEIGLQPFDKIIVRTVPDFELQQMVQIQGEVNYPGSYALANKNEQLLDLVNRSGGLTTEAFPEGTTFTRAEDGIGVVIARLDKVLEKPNSRFNYILKAGDIITIPKSKDLVTINLKATLAAELYPDKLISDNKLSIAYLSGKRAKWYLNEYAAGIDRKKRARKRFISVEFPNGELKRGNFLISPKVKSGSIISTGVKPQKVKEPKPEKEKKSVDWDKALSQILAVTTVFATLTIALK